MKKLANAAVAIASSLLLALGSTSLAVADEWPGTPARLGLIEGEVTVQMAGSQDWVAASSNFPLGPGDLVWVNGHGRAEILLPAGNAVRLGDDSRLDIGAFSPAGRGAAPAGVEGGMATFYVRRLQPDLASFRVDLPQASVQASIPSTFRTDVFPDLSVQVSVHSGEVIVETPGGIIEVRNRQTLRLTPNAAPQLYALGPWDDFDRWNDLRDIQLARPVPVPYLPAELAPYAPDFVAYGHWVPVPEYGYGWAPIAEVGWSPFRLGRWISWRGELVWLSNEPWGWVPYHFGRWRFYPATGWVWIPPVATAVIWNPGAVAWVSGPEFVAWVPLAPGEIYYGHRHYGPWSVNVTNVQVTNIHVTNVFVNTKVTNAVVVANRESFVAGGRAHASFNAPKDVFAAGGRAIAGPPPIRPVMTTSHPVASRQVTMPIRRSPEVPGPVFPSPQGRQVTETGGRSPLGGIKGPSVQPDVRSRRIAPQNRLGSPAPPPAFTPPPRPTVQPDVRSRRIAPQDMPGSSPPPPAFTPPPRPAARAGEARSMREMRAPVLPDAPRPHRESGPAHEKGKEGPAPSQPSGKGSPPVGQAGGR